MAAIVALRVTEAGCMKRLAQERVKGLGGTEERVLAKEN